MSLPFLSKFSNLINIVYTVNFTVKTLSLGHSGKRKKWIQGEEEARFTKGRRGSQDYKGKEGKPGTQEHRAVRHTEHRERPRLREQQQQWEGGKEEAENC